jgi:hypothetical protein
MDQAQQNEAAFKLVDQLMSNPETRRTMQLAVKKINPKASIPEIDAALPIMGEMQKMSKRLDELTSELTRRDAQEEMRSKQNTLKEQGYSTEAVNRIEKLMAERSISDYDAAAALFDRQNPAPAPSRPSYAGSRFMDTGADDFKKYMKDPDAWVEEETSKAIADFRAGRAQ